MKFPKRKSGDALLKRLNVSGGFSCDGINAESGMITLNPHDHGTDGFFIAKLKRKAD